ncbi:MAG: DUF4340 domain-containing protein, partial [Ruminococcus sp.]|nr:DUF4340 domain-containing protein [Ruminococcus sp.]
MKRPIIALIVLLLVAAGSVGAFIAVKGRKDKEQKQAAEKSAEYVLFSYDSESIAQITFDCEDGLYEVCSDGSEWVLKSGEFKLDQSYIQNVATYASSLEAITDYGAADDEKKEMYGLTDPATVTVSTGTEEHRISVGNMSPTGDYYYIMVDSRDTIYAINSLYGSILRPNRLLLKNKDLIPYNSASMQRIVLERDGETVYDLTYDTDAAHWSLPEGYSGLVFDTTAVSSMTSLMMSLTAEEMLDEDLDDLSRYGFDEPAAKMTIYGQDGTQHTMLFSSRLAGNSNEYMYVLMCDDNQVEKYYRSDLDFINYTPLDFIVASAPVISMANITGFDMHFGEYTENITLDYSANTAERSGTPIDLSNTSTAADFKNYFDSMSILTYTQVDIEAEPELVLPLLTVVYHTTEGTDLQVDLTDAGMGKCYVFIDGEY